ncbi:hypothetical protein UPYG_G00339330 [Umbra pygmaea]|uniref:C2H2-type domain-containing protein n=1 Tax=Umbra pygmaea TaxID=75934 RepID=A0ABD0WAZ3_UMBPY
MVDGLEKNASLIVSEEHFDTVSRMDSSVYLCSTCCQIFNSLDVVASHQLTCQPVNTEDKTAPAAPPTPQLEISRAALQLQSEPSQCENTGPNTPYLPSLPDHRATVCPVRATLHLGSSLFTPQTQDRVNVQNSPAPLIRYQCRDCEALFESLGLWQKHSKLGNCSAATGSEPRDQETDPDCHPEEFDEKGGERQKDGERDMRMDETIKEDDDVDRESRSKHEHSTDSDLESETKSISQMARSSNPTASSSGQTFFCVACGLGFSSEALLVLHRMATHGLEGALHHCDVCGDSFMNTTQYLYHRKQHRDRGDSGSLTARGDTSRTKHRFQQENKTAVPSAEEILNSPPTVTNTTTNPSLKTPGDPSVPLGPCPLCGRAFKRRGHMNAHIQSHTGLKLFKCDLCPKRFAYNSNVARHRVAHSAHKPYTCLRCGKSYTQMSTLKTHHLLHERQDAFSQAGGASKQKFKEEGMENGRSAVNDEDAKYPLFFRYKCPDCPRCFRIYSQVLVHRYSHTGKCPFTCTICGQHFFHKSRLKLHALTHQALVETGQVAKGTGRGRGGKRRSAGLLQCEFCCHRCVTQEGLDLHRLSHTGKTPLRCPMTPCRRRYATTSALQAHLTTHCPEPGDTVAAADLPKPRPFHCNHCGKDFTTGSSLNVHIRVHTGERPFQCAQCGKRFRQIPHLRDHERLHSGERPFVCSVCGKSFVLAARLAEHARTHSGEKPFSCPECQRAFRSLSNLGKHRKTHRSCPLTQPQEDATEQASILGVKVQGVMDNIMGQAGVHTILLVQPQEVSQGGSSPPRPSSLSTPLVFLHPSVATGDVEGGGLEGTIEVIVEQTAE